MSTHTTVLKKATVSMSATSAPFASEAAGQITVADLLSRLVHADSRLKRIRILLTCFKELVGANQAGLIVSQSAENLYWTDYTEHPEPYLKDGHSVKLFDPAMAWAEHQEAGFYDVSAVIGLPESYDVTSIFVLRGKTETVGVVLFAGSINVQPARETLDIIVGLLTLVTIEQRTTNNTNLFFGDFAHDQRSCLSVLSLSADALNDTKGMPEKASVHLNRIFDNSLQIGIQIENALSVNRYDPETDEYHMQLDVVDLVEMRREICDRYIQVAQGKNITFKVPRFRGNAIIKADPIMVQRAITNLIDNALKFTPEGGTIEVSIAREKGAIQIIVKDTGPGITADNHERIFERKVRIQQRKHIRGLGLGLFIVKNVALQHGGRTWVESAPGEGSTFYLTLPIEPPANGTN